MPHFNVHILGCGSATPTLRHAPPAQAVGLRDTLYMIDCGEGAQLQMLRYRLRAGRLSHIFISHLHGDHCFGLPGLVASLGLSGRTGELTVHGPDGVEGFLAPVVARFCRDLPFRISYNMIDPGRYAPVMADSALTVYSIPLRHRIPACGYLFAEKPREPHILPDMAAAFRIPFREFAGIKRGGDFVADDGTVVPHALLTRPADAPVRYAYCSDTAFAPEIVQYIEGADCLYHESTFLERDALRAERTYHSTARQAAEIARRAGVRRLVLGHYSSRYADAAAFVAEASAVFPDVVAADEGMTVPV